MFDTLLELPLFQGLGREDLTRILESTRMAFTTVRKDVTFIRQGEACTGLTFIIDGRVDMLTRSADNSWEVAEQVSTPAVVGTDVLYGRLRTHRHSYTALATTRIMQMDKRTAAALTSYFEVFRLNLLNLLTTTIVRRDQLLWLPPSPSLEARLIAFFRLHIDRPAGYKRFTISLPQIGAYLGEDPRYVSRALHRLADNGLIRLGRRMIEIPTFERLLSDTPETGNRSINIHTNER